MGFGGQGLGGAEILWLLWPGGFPSLHHLQQQLALFTAKLIFEKSWGQEETPGNIY